MHLVPGIDIVFNYTKDNTAIYSPLVSGFIGLCGVWLGYWLREKNENDQEEFLMLLTTKDLLDADSVNKDLINAFYNNLRINLRARRLDTYELVVSALLHAKDGELNTIEKDKIAVRLDALNKKRFASRIISWIGPSQ